MKAEAQTSLEDLMAKRKTTKRRTAEPDATQTTGPIHDEQSHE